MSRRRGIPKPPPEIWDQMEAASGDEPRLQLLQAQYEAWLTEQGYTGHRHRGTTAPDTAYLPETGDDQ